MKKSTTHKFNVINISEYHQSQGGGSVHADFSLLGQKWAERGYCCIQYGISIDNYQMFAERRNVVTNKY